ncbi:hypothetical protein GCM10009753_15640 [Streptantibioticus ferralitis]
MVRGRRRMVGRILGRWRRAERAEPPPHGFFAGSSQTRHRSRYNARYQADAGTRTVWYGSDRGTR